MRDWNDLTTASALGEAAAEVALRARRCSSLPLTLQFGTTESFPPGQAVYVGLEQRGRYWNRYPSVAVDRPASSCEAGRAIVFRRTRCGSSTASRATCLRRPGRAIERTRDPLAVEVAGGRGRRGRHPQALHRQHPVS